MPAIAVLAEAWAQRPDETQEEFWAFMDWVDRGQKRGAPPKQHAQLAARQDWGARCAAYDRAAELARRHESSGRDPGQRITDNLVLVCELASAKLARMEASSEQLTITVKDLRDMVSLLRQIQKEVVDAELSASDLTALTPDELRMWLDLNNKIESTRTKK